MGYSSLVPLRRVYVNYAACAVTFGLHDVDKELAELETPARVMIDDPLVDDGSMRVSPGVIAIILNPILTVIHPVPRTRAAVPSLASARYDP